MKLLVSGGRNFTDTEYIHSALDYIHKLYTVTAMIEGDARGVDRLAGDWAVLNSLLNFKYPANWSLHGQSAGSIRNRHMLENTSPDLAVIFSGGRGTMNMMSLIVRYKYDLRMFDLREVSKSCYEIIDTNIATWKGNKGLVI